MNPSKPIFCLSLLSLLSIPFRTAEASQPYPIPFKYPSESKLQLEQTLANEADQTAVVLGAGPSGLLSALVLQKTQKFKQIFIIEKREEFTRNNTVCFRPVALAMIEKLGLMDSFRATALFSSQSLLYFKTKNGIQLSDLRTTFKIDPADYKADIAQLFGVPGSCHHAAEIADFENLLAKEIAKSDSIFILNGDSEISHKDDSEAILDFIQNPFIHFDKIFPTQVSKNLIETLQQKNSAPQPSSLKMSSLQFKSSDPRHPSFYIREPKLIIIAEGTKSQARDQLNIPFELVGGKDPEHWCIGKISIENIMNTSDIPDLVSGIFGPDVINGQENPITFTIAAFRRGNPSFFVLGQTKESGMDQASAETCLKQNAFAVLEQLAKHESFRMSLPHAASDLVLSSDQYGKIEVLHRKASRFYDGGNVILLGDAAANGSPVGGLGLSLIASVYLDALFDLVDRLFLPGLSLESAFQRYSNRVEEITSFLHFRR